jgi:TRAP transporter 4TM/12TM fusion protein
VAILAVAMSLYHLYVRLTWLPPDSQVLRALTLLFSLVLAFLLFPARKGMATDRVPWGDLGLAALSVAALGYTFVYYDYITTRFPTAHPLTAPDMAIAALTALLVLEATRRTIGAALPIVSLCFVAYGLAGPWLPGFLRHRGLTLEILLDQTYFTTEGIFGIPLGVAGSYVILFIIFGAFLEKSGAGQFFMNFANAIAGGSRGGPGKVSVVSSSLFGTISGSAVANVMVDGWLTIPMMKRTGFRPEAAAAIESVASTGGQIMPPIMGAASFVMAEFLGVPYSTIMLAAAIPAILYYVALFTAIHFNAIGSGLRGVPREELPNLWQTVWREGHLFLPILVVLGLLLQGFTATYAAIIATASVVVLSWLRRETRIGLQKGLAALREGAEATVPVAMATACAGIVIGIVLQTGLALRFTSFLVSFSGGYLIPALIITMFAAIVLGMGMPTTPAYIMLAALLIPALVRLGVEPIAAHMFAFYFSCLSAVTPPVALAVYAAASISRCSLWGAGWQAVKFAATGFIVPYFFVYSPSLLFVGAPGDVLRACLTGTIGAVALAAALEGHLLRPASWLERLLFATAAVLLIGPGLATDAAGVTVALVGLALQRFRPARRPARAGSGRGG